MPLKRNEMRIINANSIFCVLVVIYNASVITFHTEMWINFNELSTFGMLLICGMETLLTHGFYSNANQRIPPPFLLTFALTMINYVITIINMAMTIFMTTMTLFMIMVITNTKPI